MEIQSYKPSLAVNSHPIDEYFVYSDRHFVPFIKFKWYRSREFRKTIDNANNMY